MTRQAFLVRSTLAAGAAYGLGAVSPFLRRALGQTAVGDLPTLNFALALEQLEARFYEDALRRVGLGSEGRALTEELAGNEAQHVTALTDVIGKLGGRPAPEPEFDFLNAFSGRGSYLRLAQILEDTGVAAYNGFTPELESSEATAAVASILQVEARHAALVRLLRGEKPAPKAFEDELSIPQTRERIEPFVFP